MNILLDFITVCVRTGAGEYCRRVYFELFDFLQKDNRGEIHLFAVYDSAKGIAYEDLLEVEVRKSHVIDITYLDCNRVNISEIIKKSNIDKFFVGCAQYIGIYKDIVKIKCEVIIVVHDNYAEELTTDCVYDYFLHANGNYDFKNRFNNKILNWLYNLRLTLLLCKKIIINRHKGGYEYLLSKMQPIMQLFKNNKKTRIVTVSEFSKSAILYHYDIDDENRISVMYSPERIPTKGKVVDNKELRNIIDSNKPYLLMLSVNRESKNPYKTINSFKRFCKYNKDLIFVAVGRKGENSSRIKYVPFLSDKDLTIALKKCYALIFPSFFEGFGYPPLEAMRYGKPILCSNAASMPEIFGNAPIYFSPFYNTDIFRAMRKLTDSDEEYVRRSKMSLAQYKIIHERQEYDLRRLLDLILTKENYIL